MGLVLYNTLTGKAETFIPINTGKVGMYICGPTVYGPPHLGHVRGPIVFDVLRKLFISQGLNVRFIRNITDVGHLVGDADEGDDKLAKQAKLEQIEPMEIAHNYTESYNNAMRAMNVLSPSVEPRASGHIIEQIETIEALIKNGFAYEVNGNVYFDVLAYAKQYPYGELSGRKIEEQEEGAGNASRELKGQIEKRNAPDFALWKHASAEHIMKWNSPWGYGYPGWHIECTAMSSKYLGKTFDIHGGGMDLLFPHHEAEIAQSKGACGASPANVWLHHNMITINGQKMAKSLNNGIQVSDLFKGTNPLLKKAFSPMTLRFFVLQAHYRSTLDFSNDALEAAEKGLKRLLVAINQTHNLKSSNQTSLDINAIEQKIIHALNDDLNTPIAIANLFELAKFVNLCLTNKATITKSDIEELNRIFNSYVFSILGILNEKEENTEVLNKVVSMVLDMRTNAKTNKDFETSDAIRKGLENSGINIKDSREGSSWELV